MIPKSGYRFSDKIMLKLKAVFRADFRLFFAPPARAGGS
jgi:hypothetical protein